MVSGWTNGVFLCGCSLTKISPGLFFAVWLVPLKTAKFNHPRKFVPIRYMVSAVVRNSICYELYMLGILLLGIQYVYACMRLLVKVCVPLRDLCAFERLKKD